MPQPNKDKRDAIASGRLTYTGYPCKRCSNTIRYTSTGHCVECCKAVNNDARERAAFNYSISDKGRAQQKRSRVKYTDRRRETLLLKLYGITVADYNNMLAEQNSSCAICGCHEDTLKKRLNVDHCHTTGAIRGLLCHKCNSGLGQFNDDPTLLERAKAYLK